MILSKKNPENTCNSEINILDIRNNAIYTKDNLLISIIKINSINMQLFSRKELQNKVKDITSEFSAETKELKFFSISRPFDVASLVDSLREILNNSNNQIQKSLLKRNISETLKLTLTGEIVERQNFVIIFEKYDDNAEREIQKRAIELAKRFENCGIKAEILDETLLVQLCNSFTNVLFGAKEDSEVEEKIPYLSMEGEIYAGK